MNKFVSVLNDRLGNVLFEIAAGKYYANKHNFDYYVCPNGPYKNIHNEYLKYFKFKISNINNCNLIVNPDHPLIYKPFNNILGNVYCKSYCQSEQYWDANREWCIELFKQPEIIDYIKTIYTNIDFENTVSIHIRRGDFALCNFNWTKIPSISFYVNAMKMSNATNFIMVSDDIKWCKQQFKDYTNIIFIDNSNKKYPDYLLDLYIQTLCKDNIISNSTFSWWGAYLNIHKDRKVYWNSPWWNDKNNWSGDIIPENDNWVNISE